MGVQNLLSPHIFVAKNVIFTQRIFPLEQLCSNCESVIVSKVTVRGERRLARSVWWRFGRWFLLRTISPWWCRRWAFWSGTSQGRSYIDGVLPDFALGKVRCALGSLKPAVNTDVLSIYVQGHKKHWEIAIFLFICCTFLEKLHLTGVFQPTLGKGVWSFWEFLSTKMPNLGMVHFGKILCALILLNQFIFLYHYTETNTSYSPCERQKNIAGHEVLQ